ncbi:MAG: hypothetical protein ABJC66_15965 [Gammaproteobacteria bacterium]
MTPTQFIQAPLQAKLSVARVFWLYGVAGSLVYGCLEFFLDPDNAFLMRLYTIGGCLYSAYVIVGTYRCSVNCSTEGMARLVRISSIVSLILLPILAYFELSGVFSSDLSQLEQLNF